MKELKPSKLLEKAKDYLHTDWAECNASVGRWEKDPFICNAVKLAAGGHAGWADKGRTPEAKKVLAHINKLLGYHSTLSGWLKDNYGITASAHDCKTFSRLQATRLAWMDDMIAYWKAKGQ